MTRHDNIGAEFEPVRTPCRQSQRDKRLNRRRQWRVREPQRVEAALLETVDETDEPVTICRRARAGDSYADLQDLFLASDTNSRKPASAETVSDMQ